MFTWYIMMTSAVFQLTPGYYTVIWSPSSYMPASLFLNRRFKDDVFVQVYRPRSLKQGHLFTGFFSSTNQIGVALNRNILKEVVWSYEIRLLISIEVHLDQWKLKIACILFDFRLISTWWCTLEIRKVDIYHNMGMATYITSLDFIFNIFVQMHIV